MQCPEAHLSLLGTFSPKEARKSACFFTPEHRTRGVAGSRRARGNLCTSAGCFGSTPLAPTLTALRAGIFRRLSQAIFTRRVKRCQEAPAIDCAILTQSERTFNSSLECLFFVMRLTIVYLAPFTLRFLVVCLHTTDLQ